MEHFITDDWLVPWPTDCPAAIDAVLSRPRLRAAVVMWLTRPVTDVQRLWTVCLQCSGRTQIEQRGYACLGNKDPRFYTPEVIQRFAERHTFHWSLSLPGSLGADCARVLREAGAWSIRGEPVGFVPMLDGISFFVAAWRRGWGGCRFLSNCCALYREGVSGSAVADAVYSWCDRSPRQFRRAARLQRWLGWLPLQGPLSHLWR